MCTYFLQLNWQIEQTLIISLKKECDKPLNLRNLINYIDINLNKILTLMTAFAMPNMCCIDFVLNSSFRNFANSWRYTGPESFSPHTLFEACDLISLKREKLEFSFFLFQLLQVYTLSWHLCYTCSALFHCKR